MKTVTMKERKGEYSMETMRRLTVTAVMAAMITLMTAYIFHIPVGIHGGYVHLGDALIYLTASILPLPYACAAGIIGGGLADLLTAPMWAPATMIIKGLLCIPFSRKGNKIISKKNLFALLIAGLITIFGYYIAEGILYGFTMAFFVSITGNAVQAAGSAAVYIVFASALDKIGFKMRFCREL